MNSTKFNKKETLVIAHRGLSGIEKENTMPAFVAAGNRSYFGIETDVHRTSDGRFVIIHDDRTGRVCDTDLSVEGSSFDDLRALYLNDRDGGKRIDLRIPTLEEYVGTCARYDKIGVLELKNDFTSEDIGRIIDIIKAHGQLDRIIFISFSYENLVKLRGFLPDQKAQYLVGEYSDALPEKLKRYGFGLDIYYKSLTKEIVDRLHSENIEINCWTVDSKEDGERLADWGVDYITSNILE